MKNFLKITLIGALSGLLNGFFGSGGGAVVVPFIENFVKMPAKRAHATAVGVILPLCVVSAVIYFLKGDGYIDFKALVFVSVGGLIGGFVGAKALSQITVPFLHKIFGAAMLIAGFRMIWN